MKTYIPTVFAKIISFLFLCFASQDVSAQGLIITEIAMPTDAADGYFIELYNNSDVDIDLFWDWYGIEWKNTTVSTNTYALDFSDEFDPNNIVKPGGTVIINLHSTSSTPVFSNAYGFNTDFTFTYAAPFSSFQSVSLTQYSDPNTYVIKDSFTQITGGGRAGTTITTFGSGTRIKRNDPNSLPNSGNVNINNWNITSSATKSTCTPGALENEYRYDLDGVGTEVWKPYNTISGITSANNILVFDGDANVTTNVNVNNIEVKSGTSLTMDNSTKLDVSGNITNSGNLFIKDGSTLWFTGTQTGEITYRRDLTNDWYLVSSPVSGETIEDVRTNNTFVQSTTSNAIAFAYYGNSNRTTGYQWQYFLNTSTGTIASGDGFTVKLQNPGFLDFSGQMVNGNKTISIDNKSSASGNGYNLIGNPYPTYISANSNADAINNILDVNTNLFSQATLWIWDYLTGTYTAYNHISNGLHIAPGQAFFVESNTTGGSFLITEAMRTHQGSDTFQKGNKSKEENSSNAQVFLNVSNGNATKQAKVYYLDNATVGFDNGYDSTVFNASASFSIYTSLVSGDDYRNFEIQSLPNNNYDNIVVPIGINAASGTELDFSIQSQNLPENIEVFIEDKLRNTFNKLDSGVSYKVVTNEKLAGTGRFYLYTITNNQLDIDDVGLSNLAVYTISNGTKMRIEGLQNSSSQLELFDVNGKIILSNILLKGSENTINLPQLSKGIYLVKIKNNNIAVTRKIAIK